uniref:EF-hand domain-containing protein n=1 Tax=Pyramimonas obovata TaxID=1411642 RepID=A0A7S0QZ49_9CHLO|mmetsp:Transcript_19438/g.42526  ORF Transcript_19438/g.42526 Transcript_19438/m.42526 type:complete len:481 (+) Transcript_19438:172-1614(+)
MRDTITGASVGEDTLPVGKVFASFADERTGYADLDDENSTAAHAAAKSAHTWKQILRKKKRVTRIADGKLLKLLFGESDGEVEKPATDQFDEKVQRIATVHREISRKNSISTVTTEALQEEHTSNVSHAMTNWLKKRGYKVPSELNKKQKAELLECFNLIDRDGSGHIDLKELKQAFSYLGVSDLSPKVVERMFNSVDSDNSGEIDFKEFVEVMTSTLEKRRSQATDGHYKRQPPQAKQKAKPLPFKMLAMAYRRRKLINSTFEGSVRERQKIIQDHLAKVDAARNDQLEEMRSEYMKLKTQQQAGSKCRIARMLEKMKATEQKREREILFNPQLAKSQEEDKQALRRRESARRYAKIHMSPSHRGGASMALDPAQVVTLPAVLPGTGLAAGPPAGSPERGLLSGKALRPHHPTAFSRKELAPLPPPPTRVPVAPRVPPLSSIPSPSSSRRSLVPLSDRPSMREKAMRPTLRRQSSLAAV